MSACCSVVESAHGNVDCGHIDCTLYVAVMTAGEKPQPNQLCHILMLLCRQPPLTDVLNSGEKKGMVAWRRLVNARTFGEVKGRGTLVWACRTGTSRMRFGQGWRFSNVTSCGTNNDLVKCCQPTRKWAPRCDNTTKEP